MAFVGCHKGGDVTAQENKKTTPTVKDSKAVIALYKEVDSLTMAGKMDRKKMQQFATDAVDYANAHPADTLSPHFLLYAGITQMQVAFTNENAQQRETQALQSVRILENLRHGYPDYKNLSLAFFYKAQIYENLGRTDEAKQAYWDLVHRFPDSELGKNIAAYLEADGYKKSADDIWQEF